MAAVQSNRQKTMNRAAVALVVLVTLISVGLFAVDAVVSWLSARFATGASGDL